MSRKITNVVVKIKLGLAKELRLRNLEAERDWGFAGDYVKAMWLMLQQDKPDDYVIATGKTHSVKEFVKVDFNIVGLNWQDYTTIDRAFYRPAEVHLLKGDYSKVKRKLGWKPTVNFEQLVTMMVDSDLQQLKN